MNHAELLATIGTSLDRIIGDMSHAYYAAQREGLPLSEYDAWQVLDRGYTPAQMAAEADKRAKACKAVAKRQAIERRVVRKAVQAFLAAGYAVTVNYGADEPCPVRRSTKLTAIMNAVQACDEEWLHVLAPVDGGWKLIGTVLLVYGNDGWDVIADYSTRLEDVLAPVNAYADTLC